MIKTIEEVYKNGWQIRLSTGIRRFKKEGDKFRDFHERYTYRANKNGISIKSQWEGFEKPQECISDLISSINDIEERL